MICQLLKQLKKAATIIATIGQVIYYTTDTKYLKIKIDGWLPILILEYMYSQTCDSLY